MKVIAINGSPRPLHNTGTLLNEAVKGAISKGAEVELINLYKLNYKGCSACFSCKRKGSQNPHCCAVKDDLTEVLEKIKAADAIIFASPIYFYNLSGEMRSFLERLLFQYLPYDKNVTDGTYFPRKLKTAFIYSMGVPEGLIGDNLKPMENFISQIFRTPIETFYSYNSYPFIDEPSNYETSVPDLEITFKRRKEEFPKECKKAFDLGASLVTLV